MRPNSLDPLFAGHGPRTRFPCSALIFDPPHSSQPRLSRVQRRGGVRGLRRRPPMRHELEIGSSRKLKFGVQEVDTTRAASPVYPCSTLPRSKAAFIVEEECRRAAWRMWERLGGPTPAEDLAMEQFLSKYDSLADEAGDREGSAEGDCIGVFALDM
ncbi:unnamed protein product [Chrysoparadoxa australica]